MVLHDIADDAELVKVSAAALRVDVLLPRDVEALHVLLRPDRVEECLAGDALPDQVLDGLLGQVVIQTEQLLLNGGRSVRTRRPPRAG